MTCALVRAPPSPAGLSRTCRYHWYYQGKSAMAETRFWQYRQDRDSQTNNPFLETGIKTFNMPIFFLRLGLRLSKCQSLFRD